MNIYLCRKAQNVNLVGQAIGGPKMTMKKDDTGTERFLEYFYKECVHILFRPLVELPEWKSCKGLSKISLTWFLLLTFTSIR